MSNATIITLLAPCELALAVRVEAARQNKSRSEAIREGMRMWLSEQKETADSVQPGRASLSAASDTR